MRIWVEYYRCYTQPACRRSMVSGTAVLKRFLKSNTEASEMTATQAAATRISQAEFDKLFQEVCNWGRWGSEELASER